MNYFHRRKNAFIYAFAGLSSAFMRESHIRLHVLAALFAVSAGWYFSVTPTEWLIIAVCIALVFVLELLNTAIEKICDLVMPQPHPEIKYIKDISAGAVLITCILSLIAAFVIFVPHIWFD